MAEENQEIKMPDMSKLIISSSPHVHLDNSTRGTMLTVIMALLPCCVAAVHFFGFRTIWVMLLTMVSCMVVEAICNRLMSKPFTIGDGSAALTGLILALNLPPTIPNWCCVVASIFAIGLGKMVYGGLGYNPFNPALVGRMVLLLAVPQIMSDFLRPVSASFQWISSTQLTSATPLAMSWSPVSNSVSTIWQYLNADVVGSYTYMDLFLGSIPGSMGETSFLAILIGGIFLICCRLIRWQVPVFYIGTVAVFTGIAHAICPENPHFAPALVHVLSGGLAFGAFFMATDMVTTPLNRSGSIVFAIGCGLITSIIRLWGTYPEGITFSILLMNALTPLIDKWTAGKPFGMREAAKEVKKA